MKLLITENQLKNIITLTEENVDWNLYELMDEYFERTIMGFLEARDNGGPKQPWSFIPFPRLKKIWEDFMKNGVVRDVEGISIIEDVLTRNIIKLNVNTDLSGHSDYGGDADNQLERFNLTMDDLWNGDFTLDEYFRPEITNISDYGLKPLLQLLSQLRQQTKPEDKLVTMDRMLNVIHHTSDLPDIFLPNGSQDLNDLSGYYVDDPKNVWNSVSKISGGYNLGDYK